MEVPRVENLPPPPGIINSIKAGFDAVAAHVTAILFPLLLDVFLWLGPRLRVSELFDSTKPYLVDAWNANGISAQNIQRALDVYNSIIPNINMFWLLRTIPIGISSLPLVQDGNTPLGAPVVWQAGMLSLLGWFFLLHLLGWIGGGLYFHSVARLAVADSAKSLGVARAVAQTIFLSILWGILSVMVLMPLTLALAVVLQISQSFASFLLLFLSFVSVWVIVPFYFWSHGIFVRNENALAAMKSSWNLTRFMLPSSSMFVLTVFIFSFGLNFLWSVPPQDSWMMLVGISGHAFVSTALLASSFIYYREANIWLQTAAEKFNASKMNGQA